MTTLQFKSKEDILSASARIKEVCEKLNISEPSQNLAIILCAALNAPDYKTLLTAVEQESIEAPPLLRVSDRPDGFKGPKRQMLSASMLKNKTPRTLLYGYNVDRDTIHVYLDETGVIHIVEYNINSWKESAGNEFPFEIKPGNCLYHYCGEEHSPSRLIPDKRTYPDATDSEFLDLLESFGESVTFTSERTCERKTFEGLRIEDLSIPSESNKAVIKQIDTLDSYTYKLHYLCILGRKITEIDHSDLTDDTFFNHPTRSMDAMRNARPIKTACSKAKIYLRHNIPLDKPVATELLNQIQELESKMKEELPEELIVGIKELKTFLSSHQ